MKLTPLYVTTLLLAGLGGPAPAADKDKPVAKAQSAPISEEFRKLRFEHSLALGKAHPMNATTREDERARIDKLLPIYERGLKYAADHSDTPDGKMVRSWAVHSMAVFCASPKMRARLDDALTSLSASERASVLVRLSQSLIRNAGRPWYSRDEAAQINAEAEAILVKILKDLNPSAPQAAMTKRHAENELFIVRRLSTGKQAPEIVSRELDGKEVKLSNYRGKVVVLDFWFTGCGPCKDMIPHQRELVKRLADKPFVLVSISADPEKETLTKFLEKTPMPWVHWHNGFKGVVEEWKIHGFPTIYVLDAQGVIRFKDVRGTQLDKAVDTLLAEMTTERRSDKAERGLSQR